MTLLSGGWRRDRRQLPDRKFTEMEGMVVAKKYTVVYDERDNDARLVVWREGMAGYVDLDGRGSGTADAMTFTEAKQRLVAQRRREVKLAKDQLAAAVSLTKKSFEASVSGEQAAEAEYQAQADAEVAEQERRDRVERDAEDAFAASLHGEFNFNKYETDMAWWLWRNGYWDAGWRPDGYRTIVFKPDEDRGAMVYHSNEGGGRWKVFVSAANRTDETKIVHSGGVPDGIAWATAKLAELAA